MTGTANTPRNVIFNADCIQAMRSFDRGSVDFILTDPPYLVNYRDRSGRKVANDDNTRWLRPAFNQMHRVLNDGGFAVSFYGWNKVDLFMDAWKAAGFRVVGHMSPHWCPFSAVRPRPNRLFRHRRDRSTGGKRRCSSCGRTAFALSPRRRPTRIPATVEDRRPAAFSLPVRALEHRHGDGVPARFRDHSGVQVETDLPGWKWGGRGGKQGWGRKQDKGTWHHAGPFL